MILVDTGPLVAAADRKDARHAASVAAFVAAPPPRFVPGLVIAEVSYLLPLGAAACPVAMAEHLGIVELATLDRRHCNVVRPRHVDMLILMP